MQIVDANVLVYAVDESSAHHRPAGAWLDAALAGQETLGFTWTVLLAFFRLTTQAALFERPLAVEEAAEAVESWLEQPGVTVVEPTRRHLRLVRGLLTGVGTAGNLVGDAHLAALALEHDAEIVSFDRDFGRFEGLRWRIP